MKRKTFIKQQQREKQTCCEQKGSNAGSRKAVKQDRTAEFQIVKHKALNYTKNLTQKISIVILYLGQTIVAAVHCQTQSKGEESGNNCLFLSVTNLFNSFDVCRTQTYVS